LLSKEVLKNDWGTSKVYKATDFNNNLSLNIYILSFLNIQKFPISNIISY